MINIKNINRKGFTLIELLAVIVILAVILVVTIPSVLSSMEQAKSKQLENAVKSIEKYMNDQYEVCKSGVGELTSTSYNAELFEEDCKFKEDNASNILAGAGITEDIITNFEYECTNDKCSVTDYESDFGDKIKKRYFKLNPQRQFQNDVNSLKDWFVTQNNSSMGSADPIFVSWLSAYGSGRFPTCASSNEEDLIDCFSSSNTGNTEGNINNAILVNLDLEGKGIQTNSRHSVAFLNEETNEICVILKLGNSWNAYYGETKVENDYITSDGHHLWYKTSGC